MNEEFGVYEEDEPEDGWEQFPDYVEPLDEDRKKREAYEMVLRTEMQIFAVRLRKALGIRDEVRIIHTVSLVKGQPYGSVTLDDNYFVGYTV